MSENPGLKLFSDGSNLKFFSPFKKLYRAGRSANPEPLVALKLEHCS
jgi:hypothetical protein